MKPLEFMSPDDAKTSSAVPGKATPGQHAFELTPPTPAGDFYLLFDHDNVPFKGFPLGELIKIAVESRLTREEHFRNLRVRIRVYGGWFEGSVTSVARHKAFEFYQKELPILLRTTNGIVRTSFEFAECLLSRSDLRESSRFQITHTVATKSNPVHFKKRSHTGECGESDCEVAAIVRWIGRRKACTRHGCQRAFSETFERSEQKQVDVHLAVDLMTLARDETRPKHIFVFTSDWDFIPAFLMAAQDLPKFSTLTLVRFGKAESYSDHVYEGLPGLYTINLKDSLRGT